MVLHITASANGQDYTLFCFSIWDAGDSSINHIVIVPGALWRRHGLDAQPRRT
jgi:hypothetical protein